MTVLREGIISEEPTGFAVEDAAVSGSSIWDAIGGFLGDTVGTYATNARNEWFAREGISNGAANDFVEQDQNAQGDIAGRAQVAKPFYKEPMVIGGAIAVAGLLAFIAFKG
jgi:hypothetical protein